MTWPTPAWGSPTHRPPLVPGGALGPGEVAGGTWRVLRARTALFIGLALAPLGIMLLVMVAFGVALAGLTLNLRSSPSGATAGPVLVAVALFYVAMLAVSLLAYVYQGRSAVAAIDVATGRSHPTPRTLAERTRGLFGRVVVLVLLALGLGLGAGLAVGILMVPVAMPLSGGSRPSGAWVLGLVVLTIAVYALAIWLGVSLVYVITVMAEEGLGAWQAIVRSFQLTRGAFWGTLGHLLLLGLITLALVVLPYVILLGAALSAGNSPQPDAAALLGMLAGGVLMLAAMVVVAPYQYVFVALMYLSRTRELARTTMLAAYNGGWAGPQVNGGWPGPRYPAG